MIFHHEFMEVQAPAGRSRLTPDSVLRIHSWWCLGNHVLCWGWNPVWLCTWQMPYLLYCLSILRVGKFQWSPSPVIVALVDVFDLKIYLMSLWYLMIISFHSFCFSFNQPLLFFDRDYPSELLISSNSASYNCQLVEVLALFYNFTAIYENLYFWQVYCQYLLSLLGPAYVIQYFFWSQSYACSSD